MGADNRHSDREYSAYWARWKFAKLALPLKTRARELGYALLVHGSLARDIDMVAVPWTSEAVDVDTFVADFFETIKKNNDGIGWMDKDGGNLRPHGRRSWSIHVGGTTHDIMDDGTYIDLSVMPVIREPEIW